MENTINIFFEIFILICIGAGCLAVIAGCLAIMGLFGLLISEFYKDEFRGGK